MIDEDEARRAAREALLRPTLTEEGRRAPLFSFAVGVIAASFGGPFAPIAWGAANSFQLRRVLRDLPLHVGLLAAAVGLTWALSAPTGSRYSIEHLVGPDWGVIVLRVGALAILVAEYLLHRRSLRHAALIGRISKQGVACGLLCIAVSLLTQFGLLEWWAP